MILLYIYLWGIFPCAVSIYDTWSMDSKRASFITALLWPVFVSIAIFDKIFE